MQEVKESCINYLEFRKEEYKNKSKVFKDAIANLRKQIEELEYQMNKEVIKLPSEERKILEALTRLGDDYDCFIFPYDIYQFLNPGYFTHEFMEQFDKFLPYIKVDSTDLKLRLSSSKKGHKDSESELTKVESIEVESDIEEDYPDYRTYKRKELSEIMEISTVNDVGIFDVEFGDYDDDYVSGSTYYLATYITLKNQN